MHITIVTWIFPPDIGGPATYTYEVSKRLSKRGHKIDVITLSKSRQIEDNNITVYPIDAKYLGRNLFFKPFGILYTYLQVFLTILKSARRSDLIYLHNTTFLGLVSILVAKLLKKPVVLKFVGDKAWEEASNRGETNKTLEDFLANPAGAAHIKLLIFVQRLVFNRANKIITPSAYRKKILVNYYGVPPEKIKIINNSVDLDEYARSSNIFPVALFGEPTLITIGRLIPLKRIDKIIKAIRELSREYKKIKLLIVGDGPEKAYLGRTVEDLDLITNVTFMGPVEHESVVELLNRSDMLILNSIEEGFPHVILEAMASKTPVIATNIPGIKGLIEDGKTGLLIDVAEEDCLIEKIVTLLCNEGLRNRIIENAYNTVIEKYSWDKNLSTLEKEFKELI
jgi:glycosyltransferase involved in cell wall biosynthesis